MQTPRGAHAGSLKVRDLLGARQRTPGGGGSPASPPVVPRLAAVAGAGRSSRCLGLCLLDLQPLGIHPVSLGDVVLGGVHLRTRRAAMRCWAGQRRSTPCPAPGMSPGARSSLNHKRDAGRTASACQATCDMAVCLSLSAPPHGLNADASLFLGSDGALPLPSRPGWSRWHPRKTPPLRMRPSCLVAHRPAPGSLHPPHSRSPPHPAAHLRPRVLAHRQARPEVALSLPSFLCAVPQHISR